MEEEARQILRAALHESTVPAKDLASRIRARFVGLGDVELSVPKREPVRTPPSFDKDSKAVLAAPSRSRARTKRHA
jgi:plasmid stability protein